MKFEKLSIEVWRNGKDSRVAIHGPDGPARWFIFSLAEFERACTSWGMFCDISHKLETGWGSWLFFNMDPPRDDSGEVQIKFVRYHMPDSACDELLAIVLDAFEAYDTQLPNRWGELDRLELDLSLDLEVWNTWGCGTGSVRVEGSPEILDRLKLDCAKSVSCAEMMDRLKTIARNTTHKPSDIGVLCMGYDFAGYGFSTGGLVGGLINHGEAGWSIHT
jgi:hypothetical protein